MLMSRLLAPTLREAPSDADTAGHRLLLRAGYIRQEAAGVYSFLPLGLRLVRKIQAIVREEMDRAGAQELALPLLQPGEPWQRTGRWEIYGRELFRLKDRHGRDFCLAPTHEELITGLAGREVKSYRQLPLILYQVQNKYRDEPRPRGGLLRSREFLMKDAYSFDAGPNGMEESYRRMYDAYCRILDRCGLHWLAVEASGGAIGGTQTHEFMVPSDVGEADIVRCSECGYAANLEVAPCPPPAGGPPAAAAPLSLVETPGVRTIAALTRFLGIDAGRVIKTIICRAGGGGEGSDAGRTIVVAVLPGDRELNLVKLAIAAGVDEVELATEGEVRALTGAGPGYAGPVGLPAGTRIVADPAVMNMAGGAAGANRDEYHYVNVAPGRDFIPTVVSDIGLVAAGDPCPNCGRSLFTGPGIEVGHIFQLGTKYSETLGARFLDQDGQEKPLYMGCYGIGISRLAAAAAEQHNDEAGLMLPASLAPFAAMVIPVNPNDAGQFALARRAYAELLAAGLEVVLDDRDARPGVKFKDADLIGFPFRLTIGDRTAGKIEVRCRRTGEMTLVDPQEVGAVVRQGLE